MPDPQARWIKIKKPSKGGEPFTPDEFSPFTIQTDGLYLREPPAREARSSTCVGKPPGRTHLAQPCAIRPGTLVPAAGNPGQGIPSVHGPGATRQQAQGFPWQHKQKDNSRSGAELHRVCCTASTAVCGEKPGGGLLWVRSHKNKGVRATTAFSLLVSIGYNYVLRRAEALGCFSGKSHTLMVSSSVPAGKWDTSVPTIAAPQLRT